MRDFRLQSLLNWTRLKLSKSGYWKPWLNHYLYLWLAPIKPKLFSPVSTIYHLDDTPHFRKDLLKLGQYNPIWFQRIFEPETKGVRSWEYGLLLHLLKNQNMSGLNILDAGTGNSLLPDYLSSLGAKVTSLDLKTPMEPRKFDKSKLNYVIGDMAKLPFASHTFDIVISISAIEHVGSLAKAKKAFSELIRVTKNTGLVYLTTDVYLSRQKTDNWPFSPPNTIKDAFSSKEFINIFGQFINWPKLEKYLKSNRAFSNYRGRYFTTAAIVIPPKTPRLTRGVGKLTN